MSTFSKGFKQMTEKEQLEHTVLVRGFNKEFASPELKQYLKDNYKKRTAELPEDLSLGSSVIDEDPKQRVFHFDFTFKNLV